MVAEEAARNSSTASRVSALPAAMVAEEAVRNSSTFDRVFALPAVVVAEVAAHNSSTAILAVRSISASAWEAFSRLP